MWLKRIFCIHKDNHFFLTKDVKMGNKVVIKNGLNTGSKWVCKKCGRVKYYHYGF